MKYNSEWKNKSGIYSIRCKVNDKRYIGKSINLYQRLKSHTTALNRKLKDENVYLINAWNKYGSDNFIYEILEYCPINQLKERELYWMDTLESLDNKKGYNLRKDTSSGMIPSDETREKLRQAQLKRYQNQSERDKTSSSAKEFWKNNPETKKQMASKVSKAKEKFNFLKYDRDNNLLHTYNSMKEIVEENPDYKWQNVYAVCNGYKPSYKNFIWKKQLKI